jgi:membrane associated rhomboid family serine protease
MNTVIFLLFLFYSVNYTRLAFSYGAIPAYLLSFKQVQPIHPTFTIFTSMFLHGGLFHLASNMLYLWIFGNNVEDRFGHFRFMIFYLLCGIVAAYAHAITESSSLTPMIGASGAVSGTLGAYMLMFPRARVHTLIFLGFFIHVVRLPALFVIGFWIIIQVINGILSAGIGNYGGVAWFAHIGGFVFGVLTTKIFLKPKRFRF